MKRKSIVVKLTDAEAVTVLVALDLHAQELAESGIHKDSANTRAARKIEEARNARR